MTIPFKPEQINSVEDAKKYIVYLVENSLEYHFEDDASDIINSKTGESLFSKEDAETANTIMERIYSLEGFDPIEHLLSLKNGKK